MDFIYFLGRFHVLALHLPIGIILVVIVLEWLARKEKYRFLDPAANFLWGAAALTAIGTAALGYMHFAEGGFDGATGALHRFFGTSVAVLSTLIWTFRTKAHAGYARVQTPAAVLLLVLVTLTGHFGGNLTHGSTYLVEYAPAPLRSLAGLAPAARKVTDVAMADPYRDLVQPIFSQRCSGCHNDGKRRGGLSLASHVALLKGGEKGAVIVPGQPDESDLLRRISLPEGDKDVMPAEGKPRLADAQITFIRWWIESGAQTDTTLANLKASAEVREVASTLLGLQSAKTAPAQQAAPSSADPEVVDALVQVGFIVRQQSQSDSRLIVSKVSPGPISAAQLEALSNAKAAIVELNLARSGVKDEQLKFVGTLTSLQELNLSNNAITDTGLQELRGLVGLRQLNLYGNSRITDAGLQVINDFHDLEALYVWQTAVTPEKAQHLREQNPEFRIDLGEDLPLLSVEAKAGMPARADRK